MCGIIITRDLDRIPLLKHRGGVESHYEQGFGFYFGHHRLDRASMRYTIELRNPFLSHDVVKYALALPYSERIEKKHLKDTFRGLLPDEILDREKVPLKNDQLRQTPEAYKTKVFDLFYNQIFKK